MMGAMYILQMVDAHVDAHLKEFDLNPNLRVSIQPAVEQNELARTAKFPIHYHKVLIRIHRIKGL